MLYQSKSTLQKKKKSTLQKTLTSEVQKFTLKNSVEWNNAF